MKRKKPTGKPLLDLTTNGRSPRAVIAIDGQPYTLRRPQELSLVDLHALSTKIPQAVQALEKGDAMTQTERADVSAVITRLCGAIVVDAPPAVLARLTELQRVQVIDVFHTTTSGRQRRQRA